MQKYKKQITMTSEDMTQLIIKHADSLTDMIGLEQRLEHDCDFEETLALRAAGFTSIIDYLVEARARQ